MQPDRPEFPADMVERTTTALAEHRVGIESATLPLGYGYAYRWGCVCGEGATKDKLTEAETESRAHLVTAFLTAALEGCEVREEWMVEVDKGDGFRMTVPYRAPSRAAIAGYYRGIVKRKRLVRRYVITTPAVPVEETP